MFKDIFKPGYEGDYKAMIEEFEILDTQYEHRLIDDMVVYTLK